MRAIFVLLLMLLSSTIALAAEAEPAGEKQFYVIAMRNSIGADPTPQQREAMVGHIAHLNELYAAGDLYMAGPFMEREGGAHEGISVVLAESAEAARALAAADPSVVAGVMQITGVHQWWVAFDRAQDLTFSVEEMRAMMSAPASAAPPQTEQTTQPAAPDAAMPDMAIGGSNFIEFPSTDLAATEAFYSELFGWSFDRMDMGDGSEFAFFSAPGGLAGGFTTSATPTQDGPVLYINCDGVAATLARIEEAGGALALDAMELPMGMGYIAHFTDTSGNRLGLWSTAR